MDHFLTDMGPVWAVQMVMPFTCGKRTFAAGDWILGDGYIRFALTDAHYKERRAALEIKQRRVA